MIIKNILYLLLILLITLGYFLYVDNEIESNIYSKDINRFIAHAGGKIDGDKYTNSLEALNLSYKKGFRLLELDILKTSDDIYVATHDWTSWAEKTNYNGIIPPDLKTFKKHKLFNKYTPLDINDINNWFFNHSDAKLVTDKINTPFDFSRKFIDKNRLMMELFSWSAVKEGIKSNIYSSMPTGNILREIKGDKVKYLKELGITDIAVNYKVISNGKKILKEISNSGIHIYVFSFNSEKEIICSRKKYFYGMYADNWKFNEINCNYLYF